MPRDAPRLFIVSWGLGSQHAGRVLHVPQQVAKPHFSPRLGSGVLLTGFWWPRSSAEPRRFLPALRAPASPAAAQRLAARL